MSQLERIRGEVEQNIGKNVWIKQKRGRSKSYVCEGILHQAFSCVFTIIVEEAGQINKQSYSYQDILTKQLEMRVLQAGTQ